MKLLTHLSLVILMLMAMGYALRFVPQTDVQTYPDDVPFQRVEPSPKPTNWCEGISANNKHIKVTACSCDKDGKECYIVIKRDKPF